MSDLGNKNVFAKNLKYFMAINNKTRIDICSDLDLPYSTVTDWCNGKIYPRIDKIELLANYFEIKKSDLVENKTTDFQPVINSITSFSEDFLTNYKLLNTSGQEKVLDYAKDLVEIPKYVKKNKNDNTK